MPITWAIAAILQSRFLTRVAPIPTVAVGTWASAFVLAPLAVAQGPQGAHWSLASGLAFAWLVLFGTCFGMVVSLWLYRKLRPTTITLIQVVIPAEAIFIGTLWLGEPVSIRMLGGAALVVAAVALNALAGGGPPPAEAPAASVSAAAE
jgi:drug/metabolite transporter (DMT)-like permease